MAKLRRSLSLPALTLYGLGTTVGAGIYALIGKVAGEAGMLTPLAFVLASALAGFSALSFAELSARFPRSAGEAVYVRQAFGLAWLSTVVGLGVVLAGTVSAATIAVAFTGYFGVLVSAPLTIVILALVTVLTGLAVWGVRESVWTAGVMTIIEVGGLVLVMWFARDGLAELPSRAGDMFVPRDLGEVTAVLGGGLLAFYAFIGFEDMVNVAEEVKDVRRTLPAAIGATLGITLVLYAALAIAAVNSVPPAELGASDAPLALVFERTSGAAPSLIPVIGLFALVNGALIQIIMASRVLYGLAEQGSIPAFLGRVHPRTRTPMVATSLAGLAVLVLALWLPLVALAEVTSTVTLALFALVNAALWRVKRLQPAPPGVRTFPRWVPAVGFVVSLAFVTWQLVRRLGS